MVVSVITEIMDFLGILSLEFEYNATRVLAKPTKHKNKHKKFQHLFQPFCSYLSKMVKRGAETSSVDFHVQIVGLKV